MTKHIFHVHGMHCQACTLLIESELQEQAKIEQVKVNLHRHTVEVHGDFGDQTLAEIAETLSSLLLPHGYTIALEKKAPQAKWSEFKIALPIALGFVALFILLQKLGIINLVNTSQVGYGTAFLIGVIASLSTCMAVVGGLVLSMSATFAKNNDRVRPQLMFHGGRLVSFFILGGMIGAIGSSFALNTAATFILGLLVGLVMLILGLNLLDIFPWAKKLQPAMPKFIGRHVHGATKFNHSLTPLLVGVTTFFLPCGFTQSMQLYTLSTGSFWAGALTMFSFALGTLPVLALISFSSFSIQNHAKAGIFFKTAGLIVILFALFNLINSLVIIGLIPPIFNF